MTQIYDTMMDSVKYEQLVDTITDMNTTALLIDKVIAVKQSFEQHGYDDTVFNYIQRDTVLMDTLGLTTDELQMSDNGVCENIISAALGSIGTLISALIKKLIEFIKSVCKLIRALWNDAAQRRQEVELQRAADHWDKLPPNAILQPKNPNCPTPWMLPDFQECKRCYRSVAAVMTTMHTALILFEKVQTLYKTKYATIMHDTLQDPAFSEMMAASTDTPFTTYIASLFTELEAANVTTMDGTFKLNPPNIPRHEVRIKSDLGVKYKSEFKEIAVSHANFTTKLQQCDKKLSDTELWFKIFEVKLKAAANDIALTDSHVNKQSVTQLVQDLIKANTMVLSITQQACTYMTTTSAAVNEITSAVQIAFR